MYTLFLWHALQRMSQELDYRIDTAVSPRVHISSTCKVGQKLGELLYLLICSFLPCLSWLLRSRVRKSRRDLRITLYISTSWEWPFEGWNMLEFNSVNKVVKVKQPLHRSGHARFPGGWGSQFSWQDMARLSALCTSCLYSPGNIPGSHFC